MSAQQKESKKKSFSADWLVQGVLTRLGDTFDRLTGRGWNPSSSLSTTQLTEKLKALLDSEVRDLGNEGRFVPHNIVLKIQWDKFSTDSDDDIEKLENELHAAAIDHINDRLYHTYAPMSIEVQTDYFTEGVRILGSFGKFAGAEEEEAAINVTLPNLNANDLVTDGRISVILNENELVKILSTFRAMFTARGKTRTVEIDFSKQKRVSVGRSKENALFIDDKSVSKIHASLVLNDDRQIMVADTGSTNGTFIGGKRIPYGKAIEIGEGVETKFGTIKVEFERLGNMDKVKPEDRLESKSQIEPTVAFAKSESGSSHSGPDPTVAYKSDVQSSPEPVPASSSEGLDDLPIEQDEISGGDTQAEKNASRANLDETQDWEI